MYAFKSQYQKKKKINHNWKKIYAFLTQPKARLTAELQASVKMQQKCTILCINYFKNKYGKILTIWYI